MRRNEGVKEDFLGVGVIKGRRGGVIFCGAGGREDLPLECLK